MCVCVRVHVCVYIHSFMTTLLAHLNMEENNHLFLVNSYKEEQIFIM